MRLFKEDPNGVAVGDVYKHYTDADSIAFSLIKDLVIYGKKSHDLLIAGMIHGFQNGETGIKDIKSDGYMIKGSFNKNNRIIIEPLLKNITFNRYKSIEIVPDLIHGRFWKNNPQVVSFWNPANSVYKFKNQIIDFIKAFGLPNNFQYEIDNSLMNYEEFLAEKKNSNAIDRAKVHTMTPGPERQIMQMKLGMGDSPFGSRSKSYPDVRTRSSMSTSESFSFSEWLNETKKVDKTIPMNNVLWRSSLEKLVFGKSNYGDSHYLPVFPSLLGLSHRINCFHVTDPKNFPQLVKLQYSRRSISCSTVLNSDAINYGVSGSGIVVYLSGNLLIGGLSDLGTVPDVNGHRWISAQNFKYIPTKSGHQGFLTQLVFARIRDLQANLIKKYDIKTINFEEIPSIVDKETKNNIIIDYIKKSKIIWEELSKFIDKDAVKSFSLGDANEVLVNNIKIMLVVIIEDRNNIVEPICKKNDIKFLHMSKFETLNWFKGFMK